MHCPKAIRRPVGKSSISGPSLRDPFLFALTSSSCPGVHSGNSIK